MLKNLVRFSFLSFAAALVACSSKPPVTELAITADPSVELNRVDNEIVQAVENQVDVLAPKNFSKATASLNEARTAREKNKTQKQILHHIAVAQAYLKKANEVAEVSNQVMPGVVRERRGAISAQAPQHWAREFAAIDDDLRDVTEEIESNDTEDAVKSRAKLETRYSHLELKSVLKASLGNAKSEVEQAIKEGAKKFTPQTLAWAEKRLAEDEATITNNRHDLAEREKASADANAASQRLLAMVRQAKSSSEQTPEQLATRVEITQNAASVAAEDAEEKLEQTQEELGQTQAELVERNNDVTALNSENEKLEMKGGLEKEYEAARRLFSKSEAEVYKQGDTLLLRLKGLSFPPNQSGISTANYPLLAKVQKVIKTSGLGNVIIEGHTDSTGSKSTNNTLSTDRAEAVEGYLVANNLIEGDKISAKGFGDSKPIATNKTQQGRAQNRRVDVIITSKQTA